MLKEKNPHERDNLIEFIENGHKYVYNGKETFTSVTTIIHDYFPKFNSDAIIDRLMNSKGWPQSKYYGMTKEDIKKIWKINGSEASTMGTNFHASIEDYFNDNLKEQPKSIEFDYFLKFWQGFKEKNPEWFPYRTEWVVYDEQRKISGSIDIVLSDKDGDLIILDWKRSKDIKMSNKFEKGLGPFKDLDNCNYIHYTLQLNCYRHMLETKYNKKVIDMYIVVCHPNLTAAHIIKINRVEKQILDLWNLPPKN